ncbi:response regulator transcription factor [Ferruginibacter sp. HRS2-29]|uniref:response regulator n=1 Tax=Ferruginibacter sp. HRS2-29 TaxID=2487334 RepID=UPI0020CBE92E|nr:response regulator transcription factor [Ferruginibacter sp. HRS2-29]MCP9750840.1 DNA-binding response regulator [Ferruginibacter sp. HRS2-29]
MKNIPVAIVEDNSDIRQALANIIEHADGYELVCTCNNGEDALIKLPIFQPHIILMDINLGGINGIEVVRELKASYPDMLFMMDTVYEEDDKIFDALNAGASGYILKKSTPAKLLEAIKELNEGGAPMSSQIARKIVSTFQSKPVVANNSLDNLSKRELEILEMLATGLVYKEISAKLFISSETVRKHVYNVYHKLHVNNRVEAVNKFYGR